MIDFACKEFKIKDVIKCALNLTRADMKVLEYFFEEPDNWSKTEQIAILVELDLSTVQRSVKKLHEKGILTRSQNNLDGGGYSFIYKINNKKEIKGLIMGIVSKWAAKVEQELEDW
ncbi:MarR family transcriptional regulator [Methanococcoides alaskense]|uniref:Transcriptional regulator n=1 Tax=Methanococcoides alaskense TaxID=325778 RepID=A0AA90TXG5_9EURY|nr:MarR family transcriptional regulator [Methanococcoides alaskense]MDA0525386.1 MarR family transcriptional regulator [Methanococcoides alaskense]MDR6221682.1 putative transcriptional regulator [Methanococcoides alaskense]